MRNLFIFAFVFVAGYAPAQDLHQELDAMGQYLNGLDAYRLDVAYRTSGDTSGLFNTQGQASVYATSAGLFYQTEFANLIINQSHTFVVNAAEKSIIYSHNSPVPKGAPFLRDQLLLGVDSLIAQADSVYFSQSGDQRIYHLRLPGQYIDLLELAFSGKFLEKVTYFYNPAYTDGVTGLQASCIVQVDEHPIFDPQLLSSSFYIIPAGGDTYQPAAHFAGYFLTYNASLEEITH